MSNRIVHFEIMADDPERAAKFYKTVFGWEITEWKGLDQKYWMVMTAAKDSKEPGINGGLLRRPAPVPKGPAGSNAFVCTVVVDNIDETAHMIEQAGGQVAMPKYDLAGMAWQAYYIDTEGNTFGIHQPIKK
jgi:uncharacterized protein